MKIELRTYELKVGDLFRDCAIVQIEAPPRNPLEWTYMVTLNNGEHITSSAQSVWLIERYVERIEL